MNKGIKKKEPCMFTMGHTTSFCPSSVTLCCPALLKCLCSLPLEHISVECIVLYNHRSHYIILLVRYFYHTIVYLEAILEKANVIVNLLYLLENILCICNINLLSNFSDFKVFLGHSLKNLYITADIGFSTNFNYLAFLGLHGNN